MKLWVIVFGVCSPDEIQPSATTVVEATPTREPKPQIIIPDLEALPEGTGWSGSTQSATLVDKDGAPAIVFDEQDWNLVWMDGFEFPDGTIEFDAQGKSEPAQGSFIGVMFRAVDEATYDAVYFRPFNFRATDETSKSHAVQYVSSPEWSWERLRAEKTGQYEKEIDPAPDGDMWFHAKIVLEERQVSVYVNDAREPALQVTELSDRSGGSVGIWCFGYGAISNLQITPAK
jgi:hypothetical protein